MTTPIAHCVRCQRPAPAEDDPDFLHWEVLDDVGMVCPECETPQEKQAIDEEDMRLADEVDDSPHNPRSFDPTVVGIASQPFWLHWIDAAGKPDSHAPDFFARRRDGSAVVVDCRPVERRRPRDIAKFEATARACALAGWEYRLLGEVDALVTANLRWLAGYRHP